MVSPTPVPEGTTKVEGSEVSGNAGVVPGTSGEPGSETPGEGTIVGEEEDGDDTGSPMPTGEAPELPSGTPTPTPEPTPPTGWIEYDDDWWDAQMGDDTSSGYDDFYE